MYNKQIAESMCEQNKFPSAHLQELPSSQYSLVSSKTILTL